MDFHGCSIFVHENVSTSHCSLCFIVFYCILELLKQMGHLSLQIWDWEINVNQCWYTYATITVWRLMEEFHRHLFTYSPKRRMFSVRNCHQLSLRYTTAKKWKKGLTHCSKTRQISFKKTRREGNILFAALKKKVIQRRECLLTRLPPLKCIMLGSMRSSHLPFKMHWVGFRVFKVPYFNACRVISNTLTKIQFTNVLNKIIRVVVGCLY